MRYGWAFVSDIITGSGGTPGGSDKAIQFASGSTFSGSTNFTFDYTTNTVRLTGTLYADNLIVSSSTIFKSGSTIFGDSVGDTHQFTGSIYNTALVSGTIATFTTITGSTITSNLITGSSLVISASVISASTYLGISVPTASGGNKAIQFASGSAFSGSTNFTFDYTKNVLSLVGTASASTVSASLFTGDPFGGFNMLGKRVLYLQANDTSSNFPMVMPGGSTITSNGMTTSFSDTNYFMKMTTTAVIGNSSRAITQGGWCRTGHTGKVRGAFTTGIVTSSQTISFGLATDDAYSYNSGGQAILLTYDTATSGNFVLYTRDAAGNTGSINTGIPFNPASNYEFELDFNTLTASCNLNGTTVYASSSLPTASVDLRARFGIRAAIASAVDMSVKYFSLATGT
jgi:hypothetical protein